MVPSDDWSIRHSLFATHWRAQRAFATHAREARSLSGRAIPLHDAPVGGVVVNDPEAAEVVPGDALGAAEVARDFRADFLRDADRLGDGVAAHEEGPGRLRVGPRLRGPRVRVPGGAVRRAAL